VQLADVEVVQVMEVFGCANWGNQNKDAGLGAWFASC
jgi:hypothetical protein